MASNDVQADLKEEFKNWDEKSKKRPITFVIAGRTGVGKSTLINTVLGLEGYERAVAEYSGKSVTTKVRKYCKEVNGVDIHIIDTPGLGALDRDKGDERQTIAELIDITDKKADVLIFCFSAATKIDDTEAKVISGLTKAFGNQIWEKTVLVMTFCNHVGPGKFFNGQLELVVRTFVDQFNSALKKAGIHSISAKSIMDIEPGESTSFNGIIAVPAGDSPSDQLAHSKDWIATLFLQILKKCDPEAVPQLLQMRGLLSPILTTAVGGVSGAGAGAGAGALAGSSLIPGVGTVVGAAIGATVGGISGGGPTFVYKDVWDILVTKYKLSAVIKKRKEREEYEKLLNSRK